MRGIPEYNFPAFREATAWLRANGWAIFSPAERDENDPDIDHEENVAAASGSCRTREGPWSDRIEGFLSRR
jgi:hypothetical protein